MAGTPAGRRARSSRATRSLFAIVYLGSRARPDSPASSAVQTSPIAVDYRARDAPRDTQSGGGGTDPGGGASLFSPRGLLRRCDTNEAAVWSARGRSSPERPAVSQCERLSKVTIVYIKANTLVSVMTGVDVYSWMLCVQQTPFSMINGFLGSFEGCQAYFSYFKGKGFIFGYIIFVHLLITSDVCILIYLYASLYKLFSFSDLL